MNRLLVYTLIFFLFLNLRVNSNEIIPERETLVQFDGICVQNIDRLEHISQTASNLNWMKIPPGQDAMIAPRVKGPSYQSWGYRYKNGIFLIGINDAENKNSCSLAAKYSDLNNFKRNLIDFYDIKLINKNSQGMQTSEIYKANLQQSDQGLIVLTYSTEVSYKFISTTVMIPK